MGLLGLSFHFYVSCNEKVLCRLFCGVIQYSIEIPNPAEIRKVNTIVA